MRPLQPLEILRVLVAHEVEFVVIGGFALAPYGFVRATDDLDVIPGPEEENLQRLLATCRAIDARPIEGGEPGPEEPPVPFGLPSLAAGGTWMLTTAHGTLHVVQSVDWVETFHELRSRANAFELPGVGSVLFASRRDLIAMKRATGRPQDRIDVTALEDAAGESSP